MNPTSAQQYSSFKQLAVSLKAGVLTVSFNRPEKKNAIGVDMTLELERVLQVAAVDSAVKAIFFWGAKGNFSAGMDMKDFFDHSERNPQELALARQATNNWRTRLLRLMPQPIVCAVEGYCLGGALPFLECADWVVASQEAVFGLPEINFGFVPGGPIAKSVGLGMNRRGASYASLTGKNFSTQQAMQWGLVSQICAKSTCIDTGLHAARDLVIHQAVDLSSQHSTKFQI